MIIWRYGLVANGSDSTNLDQWISDSKRWLQQDAPLARVALREAIEEWLKRNE